MKPRGAAQRYYQVSYQLACEADPCGHAAWIMRYLAHQALDLQQPRHCVALMEVALQRVLGRADGVTEALFHTTHARACAAVGQRTVAARALLSAEDALTRADETRPFYSAISGPENVANGAAKTLTVLADHAGAERQHRAALTQGDPERNRRTHSLTCANLGNSLAAQSRLEEAIGAWSQAVDLTEGVASDRTRTALVSIRSTLATWRRRGVPGAADLDRRLYEASR